MSDPKKPKREKWAFNDKQPCVKCGVPSWRRIDGAPLHRLCDPEWQPPL